MIAYKRGDSLDIIRRMLIALIQRDHLSGLAKDIDLLKDRHALAFDRTAYEAWLTAINLKGINKNRIEIRESVV